MKAVNSFPLKERISPDQIEEKIALLAAQINEQYRHNDLVIVMVLKGAICFVADLMRKLDLLFDLEMVQCASYGQNGISRGKLQVHFLNALSFQGKDILLIDDIYDSGHTLQTLIEAIKQQKPKSLRTCVLLYKKGVEKVTPTKPDWVLFEIENEFVVGYGLDYKEKYRNLAGIYAMEAP